MYFFYDYPLEEVPSLDYDLRVDNAEFCPIRDARVSAVPFNRRWPGHQRPLEQTEFASFCLLSVEGETQLEVFPHFDWKTAVVRPQSAVYQIEKKDGRICFKIPGPGFYSVELDGIHRPLLIFVDPMRKFDIDKNDPNVIYYGPGYHIEDTIELKDNQTLFLDEACVLFASVKARDAHNVRILGYGILDGSRTIEKEVYPPNEALWEEQKQKGFAVTNVTRQDAIRLEYCDNVVIDGITIRDSLLYTIRPICCRKVHIENVKIIGNWRYNSDGIDMHNCQDVVIRHCFLRTYDDSICVKGFDYAQDEEQMVHNGIHYDTFKNVLVEKCVIWNDWGRALEIGAETRAKEICNVVFRDCDIIHHTHIACDVQNVDYADVHDITFENIRVEYPEVCQMWRLQKSDEDQYVEDPQSIFQPKLLGVYVRYIPEYSSNGKKRGKNRNILFKDISVTAPRMPESVFLGYDEAHQSSDITIQNLTLNGRPLTTLQEANITLKPFVSNVVIKE